MPPIQLLRSDILAFIFRRAQIHDKRIAPRFRFWRDALLAADQVADGVPDFRCERRHADTSVARHVRALPRPRRLVRGRHAQASPHVAGPVGRGGAGKALFDHDVAVFHKMVDVRGRENLVCARVVIHFPQRPPMVELRFSICWSRQHTHTGTDVKVDYCWLAALSGIGLCRARLNLS